MPGIRESFIFALEENFGGGKSTTTPWIAPPPGSFFNSTHSRQATKIYTVGSKFFDTVAYGQMNGTFNWTFDFDYYYLEPLQLAFEQCGVTTTDGVHYTHTFEKLNNGRVPSFTIRRKILNRMAGGPNYSDEITELRGCVVRNITFSKSTGTSELRVTMTGFYTDERMYKGDLDATDYKPYSGKLSEYLCMFVGGINNTNYVANTESLEFSLENNSDAVYNTCSPFAGVYYEGRTNCTFGTTCYSTNPENYKQRVYSGGYRDNVLKPMAKGLKPIPLVTLAAYDKSIRDDYDYAGAVGSVASYETAINDSDESFTVTLEEVVIKSLTWPKGNDQKLQDTISSAECKKITISIVNTLNDAVENDMRYNANNVAISKGWGIVLTDPEGTPVEPNAVITVQAPSSTTEIIPFLPFTVGTTTSITGGIFGGWFDSPADDIAPGTQYTVNSTVTQDLPLYARWIHHLTFDPDGGTFPENPPSSVTIAKGIASVDTELNTSKLSSDVLSWLVPTRTGYALEGWYTEEGTYNYPISAKITENVDLSARWKANSYPVTLNKNGGTTDGFATAVYDTTAFSSITAPVYADHTLSGYYTASSDGTKVANADGTLVANVTGYTDSSGKWIRTDDTTLYAHWTS